MNDSFLLVHDAGKIPATSPEQQNEISKEYRG
jgi:hypothetical protein